MWSKWHLLMPSHTYTRYTNQLRNNKKKEEADQKYGKMCRKDEKNENNRKITKEKKNHRCVRCHLSYEFMSYDELFLHCILYYMPHVCPICRSPCDLFLVELIIHQATTHRVWNYFFFFFHTDSNKVRKKSVYLLK